MSDESFEIVKQPVHGRDESPARLFGWAMSELFTMFGVGAVMIMLGVGGKATAAALALTYLYLRKLKSKLPDRFLQNFVKYRLRKANGYHAAGRDTAWRPPITRDKP